MSALELREAVKDYYRKQIENLRQEMMLLTKEQNLAYDLIYNKINAINEKMTEVINLIDYIMREADVLPSMPCTKCGGPMIRIVIGHDWRGPIRVYRCEKCDGKIVRTRNAP